jgi:hypothetical protein
MFNPVIRLTGEPMLTEMLAEPIVQAMMESDGIEACEVRRLLRDARDNRSAGAARDRDRDS